MRTRPNGPAIRPGPDPLGSLPVDFGRRDSDGRARYRLVQVLGEGAFGRVFLAEDRHLSEPGHPAHVAIKVFEAPRTTTHGLANEATQARRVNHRAVVRVFDQDVGPENLPYIVYEVAAGGGLDGWAQRNGVRVRPRRAAEMTAQIARGVQAIHAAGLIHADLKPQNILLDAAEQPKIADFALMGDDRGPLRAGTPSFLSPERIQARADAISPATDIFSLGAILFWLLTGRAPLGQTFDEVRSALARNAPLPRLRNRAAGIDSDLEAICHRALAIDPTHRYASCGELASDLEAWLANYPIAWTRPTIRRSFLLVVRRYPRFSGFMVLVALALIAAGVVTYMFAMARERHRLQWMLERERAASSDARLQNARDTVRVVFGASRRAVQAPQPGDPPPSEEQILQVIAQANGPWTDHFGDPRRIVSRIKTSADLIAIRSLFLDTERTFWTVALEGYLISEPESRVLVEEWYRLFPRGDHWLREVELLRNCAASNRIVATSRAGDHLGLASSEAREVARRIAQYLDTETPDATNTQFLYLASQALSDLYGRSVINDPDLHDRYNSAARQYAKESDIWRDRLPILKTP